MPDLTPTAEELQRDLVADLAICNAATAGPWFFNSYSAVFSSAMRQEFRLFVDRWLEAGTPPFRNEFGLTEWGEEHYRLDNHVCDVPRHHGDTAEGSRVDDARFIAAARTGWPVAIRCALAAREQCDRLQRLLRLVEEQHPEITITDGDTSCTLGWAMRRAMG